MCWGWMIVGESFVSAFDQSILKAEGKGSLLGVCFSFFFFFWGILKSLFCILGKGAISFTYEIDRVCVLIETSFQATSRVFFFVEICTYQAREKGGTYQNFYHDIHFTPALLL